MVTVGFWEYTGTVRWNAIMLEFFKNVSSSEASAESPNRSIVSTYVSGALNVIKAVNEGLKFVENRAALKDAVTGIVDWCGSWAEPISSFFS